MGIGTKLTSQKTWGMNLIVMMVFEKVDSKSHAKRQLSEFDKSRPQASNIKNEFP